jgi:hypothetical protein
MSNEINTFGEFNNGGLSFKLNHNFIVKIPSFDDYLKFKNENQFEQITNKNIYTFDITDFYSIRHKYKDDFNVNINWNITKDEDGYGNIYDFTNLK